MRDSPYDRAGNLRQILLAATSRTNHDVSAALHAGGYGELKNSEVFCLAHIDVDGTTIADIAERANVSKQAVSKLVAGLVKLGYLSRSAPPHDARSAIVRFTPRGNELMRLSFVLFGQLEQTYANKVGV